MATTRALPRPPGPWPRRLAVAGGLLAAALVARLFLDTGLHLERWEPERHGVDPDWSMAVRALGKLLGPIWLVLLWAWAGGRSRQALPVLAAILLAGAAVFPLKETLLRTRPSWAGMNPEEHARARWSTKRRSFPSGDTAQSFALAAAMGPAVAVPWRAPLFAVAGLVAAKRVFDRAHYPSDVLAGAALGLLCGWFALGLGRLHLDRAPPWLRRRSWWQMAALVLIPLGEGLLQVTAFWSLLKAWGPYLAAWVVLARGRLILRWLAGGGPERTRKGLALWMGLLALAVLPTLGARPATHLETASQGAGPSHLLVELLAGLPGTLGPEAGRLATAVLLLAALGLWAAGLQGVVANRTAGLATAGLAATLPFGLALHLGLPRIAIVPLVLATVLGARRLVAAKGEAGSFPAAAGLSLSALAAGLPGLVAALLAALPLLARREGVVALRRAGPLRLGAMCLTILAAGTGAQALLAGPEGLAALVAIPGPLRAGPAAWPCLLAGLLPWLLLAPFGLPLLARRPEAARLAAGPALAAMSLAFLQPRPEPALLLFLPALLLSAALAWPGPFPRGLLLLGATAVGAAPLAGELAWPGWLAPALALAAGHLLGCLPGRRQGTQAAALIAAGLVAGQLAWAFASL